MTGRLHRPRGTRGLTSRPLAVTLVARWRRASLGAAWLVALHPMPCLAQSSTERLAARIQTALDSLHAQGSFPGATVGVALPDGSSFGLAVGMSDTIARTPMRPEDRMLQGSVGKTYFAAVAMQLVSEGRLDLDAPIARYLDAEPWFDRLPNARAATVRMLMNHTSGIERYELDPRFTRDLTADPDRVWTPQERIAYVLDRAAPFAAGQGWVYSDTNYIVLGLILQRITGENLYDMVRKRILEPLQLFNTVASDSRVIPGLVQGYAGPNNPFGGTDPVLIDGRFVVNPQFEWTGGGFASTTEDLARWARELYEGRVYEPALLDTALQGVEARGLGTGARYGLGVIIRETPLGRSYGHSGFFPGYLTEMQYFPQHRIAVAMQVNTSAGRPFGRSPAAVLMDMAAIVVAGAGR